ncbi:MAG TPA: hypothetical protein PLM75_08975 [bacterium]|nr:hypothetical protein [bacterium]HPP87976.1 hypothetical protein [bacterium]
MKKDDIILTIFLTVVVLLIAKSATLTFNPRMMGLLGILFFAVIIALALK